jgi:hypothetical protein
VGHIKIFSSIIFAIFLSKSETKITILSLNSDTKILERLVIFKCIFWFNKFNIYCSLHAKLSTCALYIAYKLQLAKWQIKEMRDQKKWFLYRKCVNLNVKGATDYQLQLKRIIIALILMKQESYLQLVWKLVQAEDFSILLNKCRNNYFLI